MNGTGTASDPYQITTVQELRAVMSYNNSYGKVMRDLDCNEDGVYEWTHVTSSTSSGNSRFKEIDFDGHYLNNVYIASGDSFFEGYYSNNTTYQIFKNGAILNVYENGATTFATSCNFRNMAISLYMKDLSSYVFGRYARFDFCNIYIENYNNKNVNYWFCPEGEATWCDYKNSRFYLKGKIGYMGLLYRAGYNNQGFLGMKDCLLEGKLTGSIEGYGYLINGDRSATSGCVYNIDISEVGSCIAIAYANSSASANVINKDLLPEEFDVEATVATQSGLYKYLSDSDFHNPTKVIEAGFNVVEVSS